MWSYENSKLQDKNFAPFLHLNFFLDEIVLDVDEGVLELIKRHISIFSEEIPQHFSDWKNFQKYCCFVNNPYKTCVGDLLSQGTLHQKQFIDLVNDGNARSLFSEKSCSDFWIKMAQTYPDISKMALKTEIISLLESTNSIPNNI